MKTLDLSKRLKPIVDRFATTLAQAVAKRVDATITEFEVSFESAMVRIGEPGGADMQAAPTPSKPSKPTKRRALKSAPSVQTSAPRAKPDVTSHGKPRKRAQMVCSNCGAVGFRKDGCGRTHNVKAERTSDDDSDDEPATAPTPRRGRSPEIQMEQVIPHSRLVSMLAADREQNALGDAGGVVLRADRAPSLIGRTDEKREFCHVHGWVGRVAFERDKHDLCALRTDAAPCSRCNGTKLVGDHGIGGLCRRCNGSGVEPEQLDAPEIPKSEPLRATATPRTTYLDGTGRRRRRRTAPRAKTIARRRITREDLRIGALMYPPVDIPRPKTRAECRDAPRPCPWVACKHHLYLDINPETGSIKINFPDVEPWDLIETCSLDVAERGGLTLEDLGQVTNLTRERIRQVEVRGLLKLKVHKAQLGEDADQPDEDAA